METTGGEESEGTGSARFNVDFSVKLLLVRLSVGWVVHKLV